MTNNGDEYDDDTGFTIPPDDPIWAEREAITFPTVDGIRPHKAMSAAEAEERREILSGMPFPDTAGFFADQITESASAMRPVPTLCLAVCPSHHWSCAAELPHGNGAHVCNHGDQPHHFFTRKQ